MYFLSLNKQLPRNLIYAITFQARTINLLKNNPGFFFNLAQNAEKITMEIIYYSTYSVCMYIQHALTDPWFSLEYINFYKS